MYGMIYTIPPGIPCSYRGPFRTTAPQVRDRDRERTSKRKRKRKEKGRKQCYSLYRERKEGREASCAIPYCTVVVLMIRRPQRFPTLSSDGTVVVARVV